ncbi:hypothetical protein F2Q68_00023529 [Brassica cretica]|uniref:Uncharacterized protein n=1 Tax=Brassica cretica TaxID=69181 RepID=A0A8S9FXS0_BRACR|nr:hypothetical protein F2Q68_00023529 [Brassica cretica]
MLKVFHYLLFSAFRRRQCFDSLLPLDFRLLFWLQEKGKQKGSTRISEVSRNIYPLYSHGSNFHNASVKTVVREWVDSGPFSGRGFAEPCIIRLGRFPPVVKTAVPVDGRFEHIPMLEKEKRMEIPEKKRMEIPEKQMMERRELVARVPTIMCTFAIVS